jgi:3-(3-hydroxy-phenyl)propionate hydroxylase
VGTLFIQPRVDTREQQNVLLDDVIGPWFAVLCWNNNPRMILGEEAFEAWKALGAVFVALRPLTQLSWPGQDDPDVVVVGDRTGALKAWFDAPELSAALFDKLTLTPGGNDGPGPLLHVAQPAAERARPVSGTARGRGGRAEHRT